MIGQSFKFRVYDSQISGSFRNIDSAQRFHGLAKSERMRKRAVSGNFLGQNQFLFHRQYFKQFLASFMHKSKPRLEIDYFLAGHIESEMPGFNNTGMDRPYRNFINPLSFYFIKLKRSIRFLRPRLPIKIFSQRKCTFRPILVENQRSWIRMALRIQTEKSFYFSFISGSLVNIQSQRRKFPEAFNPDKGRQENIFFRHSEYIEYFKTAVFFPFICRGYHFKRQIVLAVKIADNLF